MSVNEYSDALYNFILSQKLTTLLGNFPEVNTRICVNTYILVHMMEWNY